MNEKTELKEKLYFDTVNYDAWLPVIKLITASRNIILSTHENSDCDGLGSESALLQILKILGKDVKIINPTKVFESYMIIPEIKNTFIFDPSNETHIETLTNGDLFILLDTNYLKRAGVIHKYVEFQCELGSMQSICIDHHLEPSLFADVTVCDSRIASTGELVFSLIKAMEKYFDKKLLNKNIATSLYTAIMTDTQSFRLPKVSPQTHLATSELLAEGVSPFELYSAVYFNLTLPTLKLISTAIQNIQLIENDQIGYFVITQEILEKTGATIFETEKLFEYLLGIASVKIALLFVQVSDEETKLSLRSKADYPVNLIAKSYGGGGHRNASGCKVTLPIHLFVSEVVEKSIQLLKTDQI